MLEHLRGRRRILALGVVLAAAALAIDPAMAGVRREPQTNGSLERTHRACQRDRDQITGAILKTCDYAYFARSTADTESEQTYSAAWLQVSVAPLRHRCFVGARGAIRKEDAGIVAHVPRRPTMRGRNDLTLKLASDDHRIGALTQAFWLSGGVTSTEVIRSDRGDRLIWRWRGHSHDPIVIVVGAGFEAPLTEEGYTVTHHSATFKVIHC